MSLFFEVSIGLDHFHFFNDVFFLEVCYFPTNLANQKPHDCYKGDCFEDVKDE